MASKEERIYCLNVSFLALIAAQTMTTLTSQFILPDQTDRIRRQIKQLSDAMVGEEYGLPPQVKTEIELAVKERKECRGSEVDAQRAAGSARAILVAEISLLVYCYLEDALQDYDIYEKLLIRMRQFLSEEQFLHWLLRRSGFMREKKVELQDLYTAYQVLRNKPAVEYQQAIKDSFTPFLPYLMTMLSPESNEP